MSNQSSPVSGSDDSTLRRLGEQVRQALQNDDFLSRVKPGNIIRGASGTIAPLAWSELNRVQFSGDGVLRLPPIEPRWIGKPLYASRLTPTGVAVVTGTGSPVPPVDGSPTGIQFSGVGLRIFMTDGASWYSEQTGANVAPGVDSNQELYWAGSIWTPRYPRTAQHHDTTFSPAGLYKLDGNLLDSSGNGLHLTAATGTMRFGAVSPGLQMGFFDNTVVLTENTKTAALRITGPLTIEALGTFRVYRGDVDTIVSHAATGETSDTNALYLWSLTSPFLTTYLHEHGAGVNDAYQLSDGQPPDLMLSHFAMTRTASGIISFYNNGQLSGTPTSTGLTMPTDGTNGRLFIGGDGSQSPHTSQFTGNLGSVKIIAQALTAGQIKEEVNRTLGPILGYQ